MIILELLKEKSTEIQEKKILIIDSHSHVGKDEDQVQNQNPLAPGGNYDFYAKINSKIKSLIGGNELTYDINYEGIKYIFNFKFIPFNFTYLIYNKVSELCKCGEHKDLMEKLANSWIIDQGVVFPFNDVFRKKKEEAEYRASNLNISRITTSFPNSLRLIGYCRVTPSEKEKAVNEVKYSAEKLGLRGLKLHPRSDGWLDKINEQFVVDVLIEAAKHSLPVLFDTRGKESILNIYALTKNTRNYLKKINPKLIKHLKIIIGHCAAGNIDDEQVYEAIADENIVGEISMMHGLACSKFYMSFMNWYNQTHKNGGAWSEHIIFGSDYPYFFEKHASDNIFYLISKEFFENGGKIKDTQNILGVNILKLLPEYSLPQIQESDIPPQSVYIQKKQNCSPTEITAETIAALIEYRIINPTKLYFMFNQDFYNLNDEIMIDCISLTKSNVQSKILIMDFFKNTKIIKVFNKNDEFRPFGGYKFFSPKDRIFLHSDFFINNPMESFKLLKTSYL